MKKINLFAIYAIAGMAIFFIMGIDSIWSNFFELLKISVVFGVACAALAVGIWTIAEKISLKKTKEFVKFWLTPEE